jgi:large subunit ribosomal protein L4
MRLDIYSISGEKTGKKATLSDTIFAASQNEHIVYLDIKAINANNRQGTHSTKTRSEVRGGGKKPWKQKGRGVARAGTNRSPLWVGGGRVFGPEPHAYSQKVNKKAKKVARRSVLSARVAEKKLTIVEDFSIESGKTKEMAQILENFDARNERVIFLTPEVDKMLIRASGNIPYLKVLRADIASTYDLLSSNRLFIQKSAIAKLEKVLS